MRDELPDLDEFPLRVAAAVADLDGEAVLGAEPEDAAGDLSEVGVADLVDDESDRSGGPARQRARLGVGHVAQRPRHLPHALGDGFADSGRAGDRSGRRGDGDARRIRDVLQSRSRPRHRNSLSGLVIPAGPCHADGSVSIVA